MKQLIAQGAEAKIYIDKNIIKDRIKKSYRLKEIDERLRKTRTRHEANIIKKLNTLNFDAPKLIKTDEKEILEIEFIKGDKVSNILNEKNYQKICREIGEKIAFLHNHNIIHGDLTTSNFIVQEKTGKVFFVDFGLSFISTKIEDKAVDLHLLKQALESKHYKIFEKCLKTAFDGHKNKAKEYNEIMKRFQVVERRGRNKY